MRKNIIETIMGAVVLLVAVGFVVLALETSDAADGGGYPIEATFDDAAGLELGTEVRLAGLKVGTVTDQVLDMDRLLVRVTLSIDEDIALPEDTVARVAPDGLLGGMAIVLEPGQAEARILPGGELTRTRAAVNIVDVIGQTIFSVGGSEGGLAGDGLGGFQ